MVKWPRNGELIGVLRALCDTGSEANLIKRSAIKHFDSATQLVNGSVGGIAEDSVRIRRKIAVTVQPWFSEGNLNKFEANLMVLPKTSKWAFPSGNVACDVLSRKLKPNLADPWFRKANGVSLLLGIEFWATIIEKKSYKIGRSVLMQESLLGNLVCGRITSDDYDGPIESKERKLVHVTGFNELEKTMRRFWEFEDLSLCSSKNDEDEMIEQMFRAGHSRDECQRNLYETIMRFRRHKVGISADIKSMYLQVQINKD